MSNRIAFGSRLVLLFTLAAIAGSCSEASDAAPGPCAAVSAGVNKNIDVSGSFAECIRSGAKGGRLALAPGIYRLKRPVVISRPIGISTAGMVPDSPGCGQLRANACATLLVDPPGQWSEPNAMPIEVMADDVILSHLVVKGVGATAQQRASCGRADRRPLGGGIRVSAARFTMRKSVVRDFACYTALEVTKGSKGPVIVDNVIGPNGDHRPGEVWSDGVTIHDSEAAVVEGNLFVDNTDVQLIFGGCRNCRIERNRFRHSGPFSAASFAELMLHSWPSTSGDYRGTIVRSNDIDCGPGRRCGYGLMIGAAPWYAGRMAGGAVTGNRVRNAMIGININSLTGRVEISRNRVESSGGRFASACGTRDWPAVNVSPKSAALVMGDPSTGSERSINTAGCLLNRDAR